MPYKHNYDKILTRLTVILSKLNDGEALSVKKLAKEFNTSERTIQRDFNERLISFPIYQENKKWKMQNGFKVEKTKSLEDNIILDIIEKMTESIGETFSTKAHKLLSKIKNEDFNPIYAKLNIEDISDKFNDIQILERAIKERKEILCSYDNERETIYTVTISPLKIVNFEGFWYVIALENDILKKYYLKNLSNIEILETVFETNEELEELLNNSISVWFQRDTEPFKVTLFADKTAAKYFKRRPLPTQKTEILNSDGSMKFSVSITHEMEILPIVKYWIPHMYILEPKWMCELIQTDIQQYIENYI